MSWPFHLFLEFGKARSLAGSYSVACQFVGILKLLLFARRLLFFGVMSFNTVRARELIVGILKIVAFCAQIDFFWG